MIAPRGAEVDLLAWARLSSQDAAAKNVETLLSRHQLPIAQRCTPPSELHRRHTWEDRALLTLLTGLLPHDRLARLRLIVSPGTLIRWRRDLQRRRWARRPRRTRPGRPPTHHGIRTLVLRLAKENSCWGYRRIHGELGAVPALPGRSTPGHRLRRDRPAQRHQSLRPGGDRARQQAHPSARRERGPCRRLGGAAGPKPGYGSRGHRRACQIPDPRS